MTTINSQSSIECKICARDPYRSHGIRIRINSALSSPSCPSFSEYSIRDFELCCFDFDLSLQTKQRTAYV